MNKAFNFLVIAALLLGGLSIFLIKTFVDSQVKAAKEATPSVEMKMSEVIIAKEEITVGTTFTRFNTEKRSIPENFLPSTAITKMDELQDKVALFNIPEEDMLLSSKVGSPSQLPRASTVVEAGKRLVTIPVDDERATGFTVKNGDYVDLMGIFPITESELENEEMPMGSILGVTFLQKVKIFDIIYGEDAGASAEDGQDGEKEGSNRLARGTTATFEVTPEEAAIILAADAIAENIYLILRRYDDEKIRDQPSELHERIVANLTGDINVTEPEPLPVIAPEEPERKVVY
ncbi:MAG: Flp pilus assembly protein CpaB [Verrucomicrobiota bacterium]